MADEKKNSTGEQLKTDSERDKTKNNAPDEENLSKDELDAVSGGSKLPSNPCRYGDPSNPFQ